MKLNFKNVTAIIIAIGITIFIVAYVTNSRHLNGIDSYMDEPTTASDITPSAIPPVGQASSGKVAGITLPQNNSTLQTQTGNNGPFIDPTRVYTEEWVEKKIEEHKDKIAQKDIEDFRNIVEAIGADGIKEDLKGGLSAEEQNKLYSEMKNKLTKEEYERAKALFEKYSWILSEE